MDEGGRFVSLLTPEAALLHVWYFFGRWHPAHEGSGVHSNPKMCDGPSGSAGDV